jgi:hypothetical protein
METEVKDVKSGGKTWDQIWTTIMISTVTEGGIRSIDDSSTIEHHIRKRSTVNRFLMFPGTKWCGRGQTALHYHDIGEDREADVCCRDHDCCPDLIPSFTTRFNIFNFRNIMETIVI